MRKENQPFQVIKAEPEELPQPAEAIIVWLDEPEPTLWQTFQKHALGVIGGILVGAAILYLAALVRGL